jgi:hypothetical protein
VESSVENLELQENAEGFSGPCEQHGISASYSCVHPDENSPVLPPEIRGGHYIHHKHVCAVLGCEHTPYDEIRRCINEAENYISPFTIMTKDNFATIKNIIDKSPLLKNRKYSIQEIKLKDTYRMFKNNPHMLFMGDKKTTGYPLSEIIQGITYLIAAQTGNLNGKRPKGNFVDIIETALSSSPTIAFTFKIPDLLTPLLISNETHAVLIGARNPSVYKKLIRFDDKNPYKIIIRDIAEDDLK